MGDCNDISRLLTVHARCPHIAPMPKLTRISVQLTAKQLTVLKRASKEAGSSVAELVRQAVVAKFEKAA